MKNKFNYYKYIFSIFLILTLFTFKSCQKEEVNIRGENSTTVQDSIKVETRNGITLSTLFFNTSGTSTNALISKDWEYKAYNYSKIDSITFIKTSPSNALIYYTNNDKMRVANYNIVMYLKSGKVVKLENYLAEYRDKSQYTIIPNENTDLFHRTNDSFILLFKKTENVKNVILPYVGTKIDINEWAIERDGVVINIDYLYPERVGEYNFMLNNKP